MMPPSISLLPPSAFLSSWHHFARILLISVALDLPHSLLPTRCWSHIHEFEISICAIDTHTHTHNRVIAFLASSWSCTCTQGRSQKPPRANRAPMRGWAWAALPPPGQRPEMTRIQTSYP